MVDNVIILRNVLANERRRRTLEIVKFRGATHRTGEWLFTIDPRYGIVVMPAVVRQHQVTTLLTSAPSGRFAPQLTPAIAAEIASLTDVSINLRHVESAGEIHRVVAVLQTRGSAHDHSIRRLTVDGAGLHIGERVTTVVGILSDSSSIPGARWLMAGPPQPEGQQPGE